MMRRVGGAVVAFAMVCVPVASAASDPRMVTVVKPVTNGLPEVLADVSAPLAEGIKKTALCYNVMEYAGVQGVLTLEEMRQLLGDDSHADQVLAALQNYASAPYIALLSFGKVGSTYTMYAALLDTRSGRALAREMKTTPRAADFFDLAEPIGEEFGKKLPCYVRVEGKRQVDLSKITDITSGYFAANMALFRALAPMALGSVPTFAGHLTESDTIDFQPEISDDKTTLTGHATWKAMLDAPSVTMTSPEADETMTRAPYTLSFAKDLSGAYDEPSRKAHFDTVLSDQAPQSNGAGTAHVTLKDRLGAIGQVTDALAQLAQQLTGQNIKHEAERQADDPNLTMSDDLQSAVVTLPDPKMQDAAYFKLGFDLDLRKPDDTHVTGSDEMGTYDYTVHVSTTPGGGE
jgi:hypothetical protein